VPSSTNHFLESCWAPPLIYNQFQDNKKSVNKMSVNFVALAAWVLAPCPLVGCRPLGPPRHLALRPSCERLFIKEQVLQFTTNP
jgi:hypothetical protein